MNKRHTSLKNLAEAAGGRLDNETDGSIQILSAAPLKSAKPDQISFLANSKYERYLGETKAGGIILAPNIKCDRPGVIRHAYPYAAFARVINILYPSDSSQAKIIHPTAEIDHTAEVDPEVAIGAFCSVGRGSKIGTGGRIAANVFVGDNVCIGDNCLIYPGARIMNGTIIGNNVIVHPGVVIGADGFGFAPSDKGLEKVKQIGWVEIADDVEIGANTTIDRGALGATKIGQGTKIDNLVQIAHNVEIGRNCIIVSQVGISGSTKLGDGVILAGQVGLVGHIELGDGVQVGAQSGISKSYEAGKKLFGSPAREIMTTMRMEAALVRLPDLLKRVKKLEDDSKSD